MKVTIEITVPFHKTDEVGWCSDRNEPLHDDVKDHVIKYINGGNFTYQLKEVTYGIKEVFKRYEEKENLK